MTVSMSRIVWLILCYIHLSFAFHIAPHTSSLMRCKLCLSPDSKEEQFILQNERDSLDADLVPAPINIRKESILFGENPATMDNNNILRVWKILKQYLPFVVTGARTSTTADDNPVGAIYNIVFVRVPVLMAGLVYGKNLAEGHPLIVDFGQGSFVMSPLVVVAVFFLILR